MVARIYLEANTVVTIALKSGQYRVAIASGQRCEGDATLFGRTTRVEQGVRPVTLSHGPRQTTDFSLYLMATGQPSFPTESLLRADFPAQ